MKRYKILFLLLLFSTLSFLGAVIYLRGDFLVKYLLENYSSTICNCRMDVGSLKWHIRRPLNLSVGELRIQTSSFLVTVGNAEVQLKPKLGLAQLDLEIFADFKVNKILIESSGKISLGEAGLDMPMFAPREWVRRIENYKMLKVHANVTDLSFSINAAQNRKFSGVGSKIDLILDGANQIFDWNLEGALLFPQELFKEKISIAFRGKVQRGPEQFELKETQLLLMGIPVDVDGNLKIQNNAVNVRMRSKDIDLATIHQTQGENPLEQMTGKADLDLKVERAGTLDSWVTSGKIKLQDFSGNLKLKNEKYFAEGPISGQVLSEIRYDSNTGWEIPEAAWQLDLSRIDFGWSNYLAKKGISNFKTKGSLVYERHLELKDVDIQLGTIDLTLQGKIEHSLRVDLDFYLHPMDLAGLEKYFPVFDEMPMKGHAEISGHVAGQMEDPEKAVFELNKVNLDGLSGRLNWISESTSVKGPFNLDLQGLLMVDGKKVKNGSVDLRLDLSGAEISKGDSFFKPQGSEFKVSLSAKQDQGILKISKGFFRGPFGEIALAGGLPVPPVYGMDLTLSSPSVKSALLRTWLPGFTNSVPDGEIAFTLGSKGELNLADLVNSRLFSTGNLKMYIANYSIPRSETSAAANSGGSGRVLPVPLLPSNRLLQALSLDVDLAIENLIWGDVMMNQIRSKFHAESGKGKGFASINKVFAGKVEFPNFEVAFFDIDPTTSFKIKAENIDLARSLSSLLPPWGGLMKGWFSGEFTGSTKLPSSPDFLEDLQAQGNFKIHDGSTVMIPINKAVTTMLRGLPMEKGVFNTFSFVDTGLSLDGKFQLSKKQMELKPLLINNPEGQQVELSGLMGFSKNIDMQGNVMLVNVRKTTPSMEAHRNISGQLAFPLRLLGPLQNLQITILPRGAGR